MKRRDEPYTLTGLDGQLFLEADSKNSVGQLVH
jgi:hypothetical protein